jgi:hypothetical protein
MFKRFLVIGPGSGKAGGRRPRKTRPSLEQLDVRIAPSSFRPVPHAAHVHKPECRPIEVTTQPVRTSSHGHSPSGLSPGHAVPMWGFSK